MKTKLLESKDVAESVFHEHEILEMLLFYVLPRIDTNPLAHELINAFGSLQGVLSADFDELTAIKGVGENVATYLLTIGTAYRKIGVDAIKKMPKKYVRSKMEKSLIEFFKTKKKEVFLCMIVDNKLNITKTLTFTNNKNDRVKLDVDEIFTSILVCKPQGIVIAHNHLSGNCTPSYNDDVTTRNFALRCSIHGVIFVDHLIVGEDKIYSYEYDGNLTDIKEKCSIDKVSSILI